MPSRLPCIRAPQHRGRAPAGPFGAAHQPLALAHAPGRRQHQRHRHVGGVLGEHTRRVGDDDAALARSVEVDVVDAGAERGDQLQLGPGLGEHAAVDLVRHRRHQDVGALGRVDQLGRAQRLVVGIEPGVEQLHEPGFDGVGKLARHDHQRLFLGTGRHVSA
jgi:hypothetical protein